MVGRERGRERRILRYMYIWVQTWVQTFLYDDAGVVLIIIVQHHNLWNPTPYYHNAPLIHPGDDDINSDPRPILWRSGL